MRVYSVCMCVVRVSESEGIQCVHVCGEGE